MSRTRDAPASQNTPEATNQVRMWVAGARSGEPRPATTKARKAVLPTWIATYAPAKSRARLPNASGMATAITRLANMIASTSRRTTIESGSSMFVTHVV